MTAEVNDSDELPDYSASSVKPSSEIRFAFLLGLPYFLVLLVTWVLVPPLPIVPDRLLIDPSWHVVLTEAFLHGLHFGEDIIYTYGPWGFLAVARGNIAIYPWLVAGRLLITLSFVLAVCLIVVRKVPGPSVGRHLLVGCVFLLGDPYALVPATLAILLLDEFRYRPAPTWLVHLLTWVCALTMWVKFSGFIMVSLLAAALAVQDWIKRRPPRLLFEIGIASLAWWILAGQTLNSLPAYLAGALSLTRSYSTEMFEAGPALEIRVGALLIAALAIPFLTWMFSHRDRFPWPSAIWFVLFFAAQSKEAFVRHDSFHVWLGMINVMIPGALLLLCAIRAFDVASSSGSGVMQKICVAFVIVLSVFIPVLELGSEAGHERFASFAIGLTGLKSLLAGNSLSNQYKTDLANFKRAKPLADVPGTATFFPDDQALIYGNRLAARLPPVPQSFAAYNAYLSGLNASFYRGAARPDFVFFDVRPIDFRYPASSDALSWLAFLDCYLPAGFPGEYLVLKSKGCRGLRPEQIAQSVGQAGQPVAVPTAQDAAIWVQFDLFPNIAGRIVSTLARPPLTQLSVRTARGETVFRISAEAGRTGFLLSPLIASPASFKRLFTQTEMDPADRVTEFRILESAQGERLFKPAIRFRFFRLPLRNRHVD